MVCVSTERSLLVCVPPACTPMQRMPHKLNYHSPTSFGVSRLVRVLAHIICASPCYQMDPDILLVAQNHVYYSFCSSFIKTIYHYHSSCKHDILLCFYNKNNIKSLSDFFKKYIIYHHINNVELCKKLTFIYHSVLKNWLFQPRNIQILFICAHGHTYTHTHTNLETNQYILQNW